MDDHHRAADLIRVVVAHLNIHNPAALSEVFPAAEARRLLSKLEFHYTPKHASWLNQVEIEISVLSRQGRERRIAAPATSAQEIAAWEQQRHAQAAKIDWRFSAADARVKWQRSYPVLTHQT